jgi:hypothetical protein
MKFTVQSSDLEALNGKPVKVGDEVDLPYSAASRRLVESGALAVVEGQRVVDAADPLGTGTTAGDAGPVPAAESPSRARKSTKRGSR